MSASLKARNTIRSVAVAVRASYAGVDSLQMVSKKLTHLSNVMCSNRVGSPSSESQLVFHYLIFLKHLIAGRNKSEPLNLYSLRDRPRSKIANRIDPVDRREFLRVAEPRAPAVQVAFY